MKLPIYYYPKQVIFLDDNLNFLNNLVLVLPNEFHYKNFTTPDTCLAYMQQNFENSSNSLEQTLIEYNDDNKNHMTFNLSTLHKKIYDKDRFNNIAICVTDYTMPAMNGIEFCEAINEYDCKKILLTGDASHDLAIDAFNKKIINKFILKDSIKYTAEIINALYEQLHQYFIEKSTMLIGSCLDAKPDYLQFLFNEKISHYFKQVCDLNGIMEYYLLDDSGSYLMLDIYGQATWFIMKSEKELNNIAQYLKEHKAPLSIINKITQYSHIPFFFTENQNNMNFEDWNAYLQPVIKKIESNESNYYISILSSDEAPYQLGSNFVTYKQLLEDL